MSQIIDDKHTLALHVESLQAQLEEQTKLAKDQVGLKLQSMGLTRFINLTSSLVCGVSTPNCWNGELTVTLTDIS